MKQTGFSIFFRLAGRALFPGQDSPAPLSLKRFAVMALFVPVLFAGMVVHRFAFLLDDLFFPSYRKIDVKEPVFILGVPRSGTTFLHRLFAKDESRFTTSQLWELIFAPAIIERKLILGIGKIDGRLGGFLGKAFFWLERKILGQLDDIHGTSLRDAEEDYLGLIPICACFILVLAFPFEGELWKLVRFDDEMPEPDKQRVMHYYRRLVQRHLYVHGPDKQYLSKNPSFTSLICALRGEFPDCKIIGCLRSPYYTIPSLISSMEGGAKLFAVDPEGTFFRDRLYEMLTYYYQHLTAALPESPEDRHAFVTLEILSRKPRATVETIYERFGFGMGDEYRAALQAAEDRSRGRKSRHQYTLEQFALSPDTIQERLAYVFDRFQFDLNYEQ